MSTRSHGRTSGRAVAMLAASAVVVGFYARQPSLDAQTRATPTFTTVSVKRSEGFQFPNPAPTVGAGRFMWSAASPTFFVRYAYEVASPTIDGKIPVQPLYDIEASFPASTTPAKVREMLKSMLRDSFGLRVHTETRQMAVLKLVLAPGGPKLVPATGRPVMESRIPIQPGSWGGSAERLYAASLTAPQIARMFAEKVGQPVIDATGVRGVFDVSIALPPTEKDEGNGRFRTQFIATVPSQLGLKLEPATGPVEILVIDRIALP